MGQGVASHQGITKLQKKWVGCHWLNERNSLKFLLRITENGLGGLPLIRVLQNYRKMGGELIRIFFKKYK